MTNIIMFRPGPRERATPTLDGPGRILFFTGIRYEREMGEPEASEPRPEHVPAPAVAAGPDAAVERLQA